MGGGGTGGIAPSFAWTTGAPIPLARFEAAGAVIGGELLGHGRIHVVESHRHASHRHLRSASQYLASQDRICLARRPTWPYVTVGSDIIVAGGFGGDFTSDTRTTAAVWRYGAATSTWTPGPALATAGAAFAWALVGTNLHVASGLGPDGATDVDVHYVWDIAGPATWTMAARFPFARNHGGGAAAGGLFYAVAAVRLGRDRGRVAVRECVRPGDGRLDDARSNPLRPIRDWRLDVDARRRANPRRRRRAARHRPERRCIDLQSGLRRLVGARVFTGAA